MRQISVTKSGGGGKRNVLRALSLLEVNSTHGFGGEIRVNRKE